MTIKIIGINFSTNYVATVCMMREPKSPEYYGDREYYFMDLAPDHLKLLAGIQPRLIRFFTRDVTAILSPQTLRAAFTGEEVSGLQQGIGEVSYEIADLTPFIREAMASRNDRPFELTMSITVIAADQNASTIVDASPANLVQVHSNRFVRDEETQRLTGFITSTALEAPEHHELHLEMKIPGDMNIKLGFFSGMIESLSQHLEYEGFKIEKPELGSALQSAVARISHESKMPFVIITGHSGHSGNPIIIYSTIQGIGLTEDPNKAQQQVPKIMPVTMDLRKKIDI